MRPDRPGIYWIKIKNGEHYSGWIVGEYEENYVEYEEGYWESIGNEEGWRDDQVIQIGPEIICPIDD